ncbi:pirin family protein [Pseudomonas sp. SAICEU22]|uniref:Pirin family protein n=1 Tax=Pseudomonas agronomica TaxID=2979328 RepID=A0ABT3F456_9PSED|nr:pirin family protein [Pseudomonas agronomica]MCW1243874.1 pirin family protein [Pseudomonas agronomica]
MNSIVATPPRAIVHRTRGSSHGPITRLMSPGDLGQLCKPFVFLDLFELNAKGMPRGFGMHPHSGIATLTYMIEGEVIYEDTTGKSGTLPSGGMEWMQAGNGVWHDARPVGGSAIRGFQLWVALPPAQENAPAHSVYLAPSEIPREGPAWVLLGEYGAARSAVNAPAGMNYLAVQLKDKERWRYTPPAGHEVAWLAVNSGSLDVGAHVAAGEMVIFQESSSAIDIVARGATSFVLGSAVKHPHDLVMGHYSVHTSEAALEQGESEIRRIGGQLKQQGRLA